MITLKDFMEVTGYRITEGSEYCWSCYGPDAHQLDSWNGIHDEGGHTVCTVFDTKTQEVYEFEVWDYTHHRMYRWINPDYLDAHKAECKERDIDFKNAMDDIDFIDIDVPEDILEKARAIVAGEDYDTRVQVPLTLPDDALFDLMKLAHEKDVTLNQMVEAMLRDAIDNHDMLKGWVGQDRPVIQNPPFPPDSFTQDEAREAVRKVRDKKKKGKK